MIEGQLKQKIREICPAKFLMSLMQMENRSEKSREMRERCGKPSKEEAAGRAGGIELAG